MVLKDQTFVVADKVQKKNAAPTWKKHTAERVAYVDVDDIQSSSASSDSSSPSSSEEDGTLEIRGSLQPDSELESLCFFFANYVNIRRDPRTMRGFMETLLPLYSAAPRDSPLSLAITAVAMNMTIMWKFKGADHALPRSFYTRAINRFQAALTDPVESQSDELLAAVLLLEFYDNLSGRHSNKSPSGTHQDGAVALINHRGQRNFKNKLSTQLVISVRNSLVQGAIIGRKQVELKGILWEDHAALPKNPAIELDILIASLSQLNLLAESLASYRALLKGAASDASASLRLIIERDLPAISHILGSATVLDEQLKTWYANMPQDWHPALIPVSKLHPSIIAAGVYGPFCEVYEHCNVAGIINNYRCTRMQLLQLVRRCQWLLEKIGEEELILSTYITTEIQSLIDSICDTFPFQLGNRVQPTTPDDELGIEYPLYPGAPDVFNSLSVDRAIQYIRPEVLRKEHIRIASTVGGYFLLTTMLAILRAARPPAGAGPQTPPQLTLRPGQLQWIFGQLRRLQTLYLIPTPFSTSSP
jgi:hypothetical protein